MLIVKLQAYLPDINTAYISYRGEAIRSIKSEHYDSAFGALYSLNALLPEEYKVKISSIEYEEATKQDLKTICNNCKEKIDYKQIKVFDLLLPLLNNMITGKTYERVWLCPLCKNSNKLEKTEFIQEVLQEPCLLKCVPKPPERKDGLLDRNSYDRKVTRWLWNMLSELEGRMSAFREANWNKGGEDMDLGIDTSGEKDD
jgi:hypothetical protein